MGMKVKVLVSVIVIGLLVTVGFIFLRPKAAVADGIVKIELCNYEQVCVEDEYNFYSGDTIVDVLEKHFDSEIVTSDFGSYVNDINGYVVAGGESNAFLAFYVNDESSLLGINEVALYDGIKLSFKYETW